MYYRILSASAHGPSVPAKPLSLITLGRVTGYYEDFRGVQHFALIGGVGDRLGPGAAATKFFDMRPKTSARRYKMPIRKIKPAETALWAGI
jgi:hypothetical protein